MDPNTYRLARAGEPNRKTRRAQQAAKTRFVRLPPVLRQPIEGGCHCEFCKANPHLVPMWDTLAYTGPLDSWRVHYPNAHALRRAQEKGGPR